MEFGKACGKFLLRIANDWFLKEYPADELLQYLQDDKLNVKTEDEVLDALCNWLKTSHGSNAKKEDYEDQLFPIVQSILCKQSILQHLVKDETLPSALKVQLYDHLFLGGDGTLSPRAPYNPGSTDEKQQKPGNEQKGVGQQEGGSQELEEIVLLVGSKDWTKKIMCLDDGKHCFDLFDVSLGKNSEFSVCATKDSIIFSGGNQWGGEILSMVHQFCLHTCKWSHPSDLLYPRYSHLSVCIQNQLYVIGGHSIDKHGQDHSNEVHVQDLNSCSWSVLKNIPKTDGMYDQGVAAVGTDIIVVRAVLKRTFVEKTFKQLEWITQAYIYQTLTDQWKVSKQDLSQDIYPCTPKSPAVVAVGHKVFVLSFPDFLAYSTVEDQWTKLAATIRPCKCAAMVLRQEKLFVLGGYDDPYIPHGLIQTYDIDQQRWSLEEATMSVPFLHFSAFVMELPKTLIDEKIHKNTNG